ncbi:uncharacterized protein LOC143051335 [Mytilus galloprovincialis]|uniref:uncharacterized protein LOC143051335 n=1 Tax=Mytilus galloprovincialis TaxID=29158 RepID=UPI003F7C3120
MLGRSYVTTSSTMSDERSAEGNVCIKITAGGAVCFSTIIIFLLVIIYIQRRKLIKASFTSLTARRDQNYYNEIPHQMTDSTEEHGYEMSSIPSASGCQATVQQSINNIQHIDTFRNVIPSGISQMSGDHYESIDN